MFSRRLQGSKILVIGDPKSFFTLYAVVHAAGLRPCHLDREGQLLLTNSGLDKEKEDVFGEAVVHACSVADCILAAAELILTAFACLTTRELLLQSFQHVIIYVSEPGIQQQVLQGLHQALPAAGEAASLPPPACGVTVLAVHIEPLLPSPQENKATNEKLKHVSVAILPKQQPPAAEISLQAAAQPAAPPPDWPLVLSNSSVRPVKSRRDLYESIITLENEGTVIVERTMQHLDMVLSPSAALIILTEESIAAAATAAANPGAAPNAVTITTGPDFEVFLQHITPIVERIGRAFSKLHLICEGSPGFRAQLLHGHPRLVSAAAQCNLTLQCDVTADAASTSATARSIATAYLQEWKQRSRTINTSTTRGSQWYNLYYSVGDPPSQFEKLLAAVPSLNPHSAAVLANGCGLTLQQLFALDNNDNGGNGAAVPSSSLGSGVKVPAVLSLIPKHSMELFKECCAAGRALGGEMVLDGTAATVLPLPMSVPQQQYNPPLAAAPPGVQNYQVAAVVDDLPESLDEFIQPCVSVGAPVAVGGGGSGQYPLGGGNGCGGFSSAGNASADSMPAPSWCGPQLGTSHYAIVTQGAEQQQQQQQRHSYYEEEHYYQPDHHHYQPHHYNQQQQQQLHYQEEAVDEFGVPLDPLASWQEGGQDDASAPDQQVFQQQHQWHQHRQQQQGHGELEYSYYPRVEEQEAVSGYAPPPLPWIEGGMPLPGLAPNQARHAPRSTTMQPPPPSLPPRHAASIYYQQQQQPPSRPPPARSVLMNDDRISGLSSFQYPQQHQHHQQQQHQYPFTAPLPPENIYRGGGAGARGGGGARGYTAAALDRQQQQQHSASVWPSISTGTTTNTTTHTNNTSTAVRGGADYMKRKWGGGRGAKRGGGGGRGGGKKYTSRTQRQW